MLRTLDHVVIVVRDLEGATSTYTRLLGREPGWRGSHPNGGTENALFPLRNCYLELLSPTGQGSLTRALEIRLEEQGDGLVALAFGTDDAAGFRSALRARGLSPSDPANGEGVSRDGAKRGWRNVRLPPHETRGVNLFAIEHLRGSAELAPGTALAPEPTLVDALDHVVVSSNDPDASATVYGEVLGLRLALDRPFPDRGLRLLFFRIGGVTVEIAARLDDSGGGGPDRLWGLAHSVPDVRAARERIVAEGFDVSRVRSGQKPGTEVCTVRAETHGVATLLIGPAPSADR